MANLYVLKRQEILEADDLPREFVKTPEWAPKNLPDEEKGNVGVWVRGFNGTERDRFEREFVKVRRSGRTMDAEYNEEALENFKARICARTIIDPDTGENIFDDSDIVALGRKSASALDRVASTAQRLSAISAEDRDEIVGNS